MRRLLVLLALVVACATRRTGSPLFGSIRESKVLSPGAFRETDGPSSGFGAAPCRCSSFDSTRLVWDAQLLLNRQVGPYLLEQYIASGSSGHVYKATKEGRVFAVKVVLRNENVANEVSIMRHMDRHPNVVNLVDVMEYGSMVLLVLDYAAAGDLLSLVQDEWKHNARMDLNLIRHIFRQIVDGLEHLHSQGVAHRDLKFDNVLVVAKARFPRVKIADFGLSLHLANATRWQACGTLAYFAPEMWTGEDGGFESDIWAAGVMLYAMLTGGMPFTTVWVDSWENYKESFRDKVVKTTPKWPIADKGILDLLKGMLMKRKRDRWTIRQVKGSLFYRAISHADLHRKLSVNHRCCCADRDGSCLWYKNEILTTGYFGGFLANRCPRLRAREDWPVPCALSRCEDDEVGCTKTHKSAACPVSDEARHFFSGYLCSAENLDTEMKLR